MKDLQNRNVTYLRLSVTDLCNLRCTYCMPQDGVPKRNHREVCSLEELRDFVSAACKLGITKVRLTGGEPLVRHGIVELCAMLRKISGLQELCLTTNGILLPQYAKPLLEAGVDRLNISLDTLDREKYSSITRIGKLSDVLSGIEAAEQAGFPQLKINCVLLGGFNEDEIADFVGLTKEKPIQVRFIELMPMSICSMQSPGQYISSQTVLSRVPQLERCGKSGVAELYRLPGAMGTVGLISPVSKPFCNECNRIRITADGKLKPCLHSDVEVSLRGMNGEKLEQAISEAILSKPLCHRLSESGKSDANRNMFEIGG